MCVRVCVCACVCVCVCARARARACLSYILNIIFEAAKLILMNLYCIYTYKANFDS